MTKLLNKRNQFTETFLHIARFLIQYGFWFSVFFTIFLVIYLGSDDIQQFRYVGF